MIKSNYLEGTNKKAFVIEDGTERILVTYARPAVFVLGTNPPVRIWDGFRITSGKHILKFDKTLTKKVWESMKVENSPCTGKFVSEEKTNAVQLDFKKMSFLVINGKTVLCKYDGGFCRVANDIKYPKRYIEYLTKFAGKEITSADWDKFDVNENLKF